MKKLFFLFFLIGLNSIGQTPKRIKFMYDSAGNQIRREIIINAPARISNDTIYKTPETLTPKDLIEDIEYSDIKYYPNPVLEELYVNWSNTNEKYISSIELYALNGQLLLQNPNLKRNENTIVSFRNFPDGYYSLLLMYNNGERKTLKILKAKK
ncbi:T9SS type A sorting domain-containing protein [Flavobacterium sp. H122]|uniref:T9SS type A sorting domain-containing protein n=1 Tax=Flavobacterium sp. H122 TaxID=2529860 RepID=UPI0010AA6A8B|nr:T9SS type A sorting domain-containing protein [Flavobacterium sp. H122]